MVCSGPTTDAARSRRSTVAIDSIPQDVNAGRLDRQLPVPVVIDLEHLVDERTHLDLEVRITLRGFAGLLQSSSQHARGAEVTPSDDDGL